MPEFVLNLDGDNNVPAYEHLPALVQGYIEALFFTAGQRLAAARCHNANGEVP